MQYIAYIQAAMLVLGFIRKLREGADADTALTDLLSNAAPSLGLAGVKPDEIAVLAPLIRQLIEMIVSLRQ